MPVPVLPAPDLLETKQLRAVEADGMPGLEWAPCISSGRPCGRGRCVLSSRSHDALACVVFVVDTA